MLVEEISVERYAKNSVLFNTINGVTFAGKGTDTEIRDRFRLESTYNIPADKWEKSQRKRKSGCGRQGNNGRTALGSGRW